MEIRLTDSRQQSVRKVRFRFGLLTLLCIVTLASIAAALLVSYLDDRPLDWKPYEFRTLQKHLMEGETVLLFAGADWDVTSVLIQKTLLDDKDVKRLIRRQNIITLYADATYTSPSLMPELDKLPNWVTSTIAIFSNGNLKEPVILSGLFSKKDLVEAIEAAVMGRSISTN